MASLSAFSRLPCAVCKSETLHVGRRCNGCGAVKPALVWGLTPHQVAAHAAIVKRARKGGAAKAANSGLKKAQRTADSLTLSIGRQIDVYETTLGDTLGELIQQ